MSEEKDYSKTAKDFYSGLRSVITPVKELLDFAKQSEKIPVVGLKLKDTVQKGENNKTVQQFIQLEKDLEMLEQEALKFGPDLKVTPSAYTYDEWLSGMVRIGSIFGVAEQAAKANIDINKDTGEVVYKLGFGDCFQYDVDLGSDFGAGDLLKFTSSGKLSFGAKALINLTVGHDTAGFYIDTSKRDSKNKLEVLSLEGLASLSEFSEETYIDRNKNGKWDPAEAFTDTNSNGEWDRAETFSDKNGNGKWDTGESFVDRNNNAKWDGAEPFTDTDGSKTWSAAETFADADKDGKWTGGKTVKGSSLDATVGINMKAADLTVGKDKSGKEQYDVYLKLGAVLKDSNTDKDSKLRLSEIKFGKESDNKTLLPLLEGKVDLDLDLTASAPSAEVAGKNLQTFLPSINSRLEVDYALKLGEDNLIKDAEPSVAFKNVRILLGDFLGKDGPVAKVIGPIAEVAKMVKPITAALTTEIAPLKAVGAPSTLLELVGAPEETQDALKTLNDAADWVEKIQAIQNAGEYKLGDYQLKGDPTKNPANFDLAKNAQETTSPESKVENAKANSTAIGQLNYLKNQTGGTGSGGGKSGDATKTGFQFPILDDPKNAALGILLGKDVDLVSYTLPELKLSESFGYSFPVPIPLPVPIFVTLGATVGVNGRLGFGFDTKGLNQFRASKWKDPEQLLNGFWISDNYVKDDKGNFKVKEMVNGKPVYEELAEFEVFTDLSVGAKVDVGLLAAGVGGGVGANIGVDLKGGDDGKFRLGEKIMQSSGLLQVLENSFEFKGKISAFAYAEVRALWWDKRFELGRVTLLEFPDATEAKAIDDKGAFTRFWQVVDHAEKLADGGSPTYPLWLLQTLQNVSLPKGTDTWKYHKESTAVLNVGPRREEWSKVPLDLGEDETVAIWHTSGKDNPYAPKHPDHPYFLQVNFSSQVKLGLAGVIVGNFDKGNDSLKLTGRAWDKVGMAVRTAASVFMGEGDDIADGGLGNDFIDGGAGNDAITGDDGADRLLGGDGDDVLMPGIKLLSLNFDPKAKPVPMAERVKGMPVDQAKDTLDGGEGIDKVSYREVNGWVGINLASNDNSGAALGDRFINIEQVEGSAFDDAITGNSGENVLEGFDGNDVMDGGGGNDMLFGGEGADFLIGGEGIDVASYIESPKGVNVGLAAGWGKGKGGEAEGDSLVTIEWLIGSQHSDTLVGSPGANRIDGGRAGENYADVNRNHKWDAGEKYIDANKNGQFDEGESFTDANKNGQFDAGEEYIDANNNKKWDSGFDSMVGGKGNDTYVVDDAADRVVEDTDGGIDLVESSVPYTLPANVEQLILTGIVEKDPAPAPVTKKAVAPKSGLGGITVIANPSLLFGANTGPLLALLRESLFDLNGTGNALDNAVVGNNGDNLLEGREGKDTLVGNDGNDYLNGGEGADRMVGGKGNDTFVVDDAADDVIIESPGSGTDAVHTSVTYTLPNHVENLTLTGPGTHISIAELHSGTGNALDNVITGNAGDNDIKGMAGNDTLLGRGGKDFLWGSTGNDSLDGGAGFDAMSGGAGNDTYVVDHALDKVTEFFGEGTDEIVSSLSWDLPDHVENLTLTGTAALNGKGNSLANRLTGNAAANVLSGLAGNDSLDGGAGADTLAGGAGDDLYFLDNSSALLVEAPNEGTDTVRSSVTLTLSDNFENLELIGAAALDGTGNSLPNRLTGNVGNNVLDGEDGADTLVGGEGNDTYLVEETIDTIIDLAGTDTVLSLVNFDLGAGVENLELTGSAVQGRGNALANRLTGNEVANLLGGGAGNDTMTGGGGDDTYVVDAAADVVVEAANEGADVVWSSAADFTLPANVENLSLTGAGALRGTGNALANRIVGNDKNNVLDGGAAGSTGSGLTLMFFDGVDTLDGGAGADTMSGGYDDDTYIVDDPGDVVVEANLFLGVGGIDTVRSSVSFTLPARVENLALTGTASHGTGNGSSNVLTGNAEGNTLLGLAGNDLLEAQGGNDTLTGCEQSSGGGRGQVDTLTGGSGNDVFVLGVRVGGTLLGSSIMFYGDGNTSSPGQGDYALITDFLATRDKLQLAGAAKDYYLGVSGVSGVDGQGLWARGTSAGSSDELIAIIRSANSAALTATNTLNTATYV